MCLPGALEMIRSEQTGTVIRKERRDAMECAFLYFCCGMAAGIILAAISVLLFSADEDAEGYTEEQISEREEKEKMI